MVAALILFIAHVPEKYQDQLVTQSLLIMMVDFNCCKQLLADASGSLELHLCLQKTPHHDSVHVVHQMVYLCIPYQL